MRRGARRRPGLSQVLVALTLASLGVAGVASAASNTVPATNAGQGVSVVGGFEVDEVKALIGGENVGEVTFTIERTGTNEGVVVNDENADVFVQLRGDDPASQWATCTVTDGDASCATGTQSPAWGDVDAVSVVAYDVSGSS